MQKRVFRILMFMMMVAALVMTGACAKKQVQSTEPEAPVVQQVTEPEETTTEEAIETAEPQVDQEAIQAEAQRRARERARNMFISEDINFDFDSSSLTAMAQETLRSKAAWMRNNPGVNVVIEGHCDERGTAEYNLALGDRRAQSAKAFLVDLGIAPSRLATISYGEEMPVDPRATEEAWAKNRRAHFTIK